MKGSHKRRRQIELVRYASLYGRRAIRLCMNDKERRIVRNALKRSGGTLVQIKPGLYFFKHPDTPWAHRDRIGAMTVAGVQQAHTQKRTTADVLDILSRKPTRRNDRDKRVCRRGR